MGAPRGVQHAEAVQVLPKPDSTCAKWKVTGTSGGLAIHFDTERRTRLMQAATSVSFSQRVCHSSIVRCLAFAAATVAPFLLLHANSHSRVRRSPGGIPASSKAAAADTDILIAASLCVFIRAARLTPSVSAERTKSGPYITICLQSRSQVDAFWPSMALQRSELNG